MPPNTMYWNAKSGDWNDPANWTGGRIPGPKDSVIIDFGSFDFPASGQMNAGTVAVNVPFIVQANATTSLSITGNWTLNDVLSIGDDANLEITGGSFLSNGAAKVTGGIKSNGSKLTVNGLTAFLQPTNKNVLWQAAGAGAELNFPALTKITGAPTGIRFNSFYFDITARQQATVNLPALASVTALPETMDIGESGVRFSAFDSGLVSAPVLPIFSDLSETPHSVITAQGTGRISYPSLKAPSGIGMDINAISIPKGFSGMQRTGYFRLKFMNCPLSRGLAFKELM